MRVFHVFGGYRPAKATIIIRVWDARCAYFTCLEGIDRLTPRGVFGGESAREVLMVKPIVGTTFANLRVSTIAGGEAWGRGRGGVCIHIV